MEAIRAKTDVPRSSEAWRAFLQLRVAGFGRTLALFVLAFYVLGNGAATLHPLATWRDWISPLNVLVLVAAGICVTVWALCRVGRRTTSELELIDALGTIATGASIGLTSVYAPPVQRPELAAVMGLIIFLILRAIVIPSTARRTGVLCVLAALPAVYAAYVCHADQAQTEFTLPLALYPALTAVWAGLGTVAATLASRTIFGLRKRAREARELGQYTLGEKLGEGGMGTVYRASHAMMKRPVAIKLLARDRAGNADLVRFEREVQLTSRLDSPNTIAIYDYGRTPDGVFYYVMEYIDGFSLEELVAKFGPLTPGRVVHIMKQVCAALSEAHGIGLVHRDVKPANIALCERAGVFDVVKVFDFGLVKELGTDASATKTATLTGTPLYISPEAITAPETVDGRSDLYAVGAVAYWLLTGTHVFQGSSVVEVCSHHMYTRPERPTLRLGRPVPADLEAIVLRCLAKPPGARFADADALARALDRCESAGSWSDELAAVWWASNGVAATAARRSPPLASRVPGPMTIDLEGRLRSDVLLGVSEPA